MDKTLILADHAIQNKLELRIHINPHLDEEPPLNIYQAVGTLIENGEISKETGDACIQSNCLIKMMLFPDSSDRFLFSFSNEIEKGSDALLQLAKVNS